MQQDNVSAKTVAVGKRKAAPLFVVAALVLSLLSAKPAIAQAPAPAPTGMSPTYFLGGVAGAAAGRFLSSFSLPAWPATFISAITNPCGSLPAVFTGVFAVNPCGLARDVLGLDFALNYKGGEQSSIAFNNMWDKNLLPAMQAQAAENHAARLDQTAKIGAFKDAQTQVRTARDIQEQELESKKRNEPNENVCVAATSQSGLADGDRSARAIRGTLINELKMRAAGMALSPAADQKDRWTRYMAQFHDPANNNGAIPGGAGKQPNADITVETTLLKDTIEMDKPEEYEASRALLINLIQPRIHEKIPDDVIDTPVGRQWLLKQQHMDSLRTIAADTVASILAWHTNLPKPEGKFSNKAVGSLTDTDNPAITPGGDPSPSLCAEGAKDYACWKKALGFTESGGSCSIMGKIKRNGVLIDSNYVGRYQFGMEALVGLGYVKAPTASQLSTYGASSGVTWYKIPASQWQFTDKAAAAGVNSLEKWQDPTVGCALQETAKVDFDRSNWGSIKGFVGKTMPDGTVWDASALMAGAHLLGTGGLANCIKNGAGCRDGNQVDVRDYVTGRHPKGPTKVGYDMSAVTDGAAPDPVTPVPGEETPGGDTPGGGGGGDNGTGGKTYDEFVREILLKAGVKPCTDADAPKYHCIAENMSSNQLKDALWWYRYVDPEYYKRIAQTNIDQEQAVLDTYITLQVQDIKELEEKINALQAARATMKLNAGEKPSLINSAPLQ